MRRATWLGAAVVMVVGLVGCSGGEKVSVDLVKEFATATRRPSPESFKVEDATLAGKTFKAIEPQEASRITWAVTVPDKGWLKVNLGLLEKGWTMQGDGVLFRIGISAGGKYDELLSLVVNPFGNPGDKIWREMTLDLSEYAGEKVDVIFNTNSSAPPNDNRNGDFPAWGAPRIVVQ